MTEQLHRPEYPPEEIKNFWGHSGTCHYCKGIVKMHISSKTYLPLPDLCNCLLCGQRYYVVTDDIDKWIGEQWVQKNNRDNPENN
jgi:hypothetical protein